MVAGFNKGPRIGTTRMLIRAGDGIHTQAGMQIKKNKTQ